jgi:hypothetical protein
LFIQPKSKENPKKETVQTLRDQGRQLSPRDDFAEPHATPTTIPVRGNHRVTNWRTTAHARDYRVIQVGNAEINGKGKP